MAVYSRKRPLVGSDDGFDAVAPPPPNSLAKVSNHLRGVAILSLQYLSPLLLPHELVFANPHCQDGSHAK